MGIAKTLELREAIGMVNRAKLVNLNRGNDFKKETNSINFTYSTSSNIYFLSRVCSKIMKLTHKITFSVQTCFLVLGHLAFRIISHSGKNSSTIS
jgi:hypothetical protein